MSAFQEDVQRVKDHLRAAILRAELPEGTPVHEAQLRAETGASVRVVKQALQELAREGLIRRKRHAGTQVAEKLPSVICAVLPPVRSVAVISSLDERPFETSQFLQKVLAGIREKMSAPANLSLVLNPIERSKSMDDVPPFDLDTLKRNVQGVISLELSNAPALNRLCQAGLPVVAVDYAVPDMLFDCVYTDQFQSGLLATHHLIEAGHRRIAFVGETPTLHSTDPAWQERHAGHLRAMALVGGETPPLWLLSGPRTPAFIKDRLSEFHRRHAPTAYVAANGTFALGIWEALQELGLRVPDDISLISADNAVQSLGKQTLSRVFVEYQDLGRLALRLLASRLACRPMPPVRTMLHGRLSPGETVAPS